MIAVVAVIAAFAALAAATSCASGDGGGRSGAATSAATPESAAGEQSPADPGADPGGGPGTFEVRRATVTLVDESRSTKAHGGQPELPSRTLTAQVWYPEPAGVPKEASFPLIVFSHGSTRLAEHYSRTLGAWASAGYVVVGPDFPLSKEGTPGGTDYGGIAEQAGDVSFVIDQVLASARAADRPWAALVDPDRVGLGGQSLGAITTVAVAINPCCADDRIDAITEFAGAWADLGSSGPVAAGSAPPALLVHGDADPTVSYEKGTSLLQMYPGEARLLTLVGSGHDPGFFGGLDEPLDELVTRATIDFYDQHLKDDPDAETRLDDLVAAAGPQVATLTPATEG